MSWPIFLDSLCTSGAGAQPRITKLGIEAASGQINAELA